MFFKYIKIISSFFCLIFISFGKCEIFPSFDGINKIIKNLNDTKKFVSISFDDGPSDNTTNLILKILDQYKVKGTFFLTGRNALNFPDLVTKIIEGGHEVANHSMSHKNLIKISESKQENEVDKASTIIEKISGVKPKWFRPPYGNMNQSLEKILKKRNIKPVLWSIDPQDWKNLPVNKIVQRVIKNLHNGAIILLHDCHVNTVKALPQIITKIQELNYEIVTLEKWSDLVCENKILRKTYSK